MTCVSFSPGSGALAGNPLEIDRELLRSGKCLPMTESLNMGVEGNKLKKKKEHDLMLSDTGGRQFLITG